MTQQEFEQRTQIKVSWDKFNYINSLYMNTDMDKDEFCRHYITSGDGEILRKVNEHAEKYETLYWEAKRMISYVSEILIGKAHAYEDTDLYNEAVRLIGQKEVTRRTIEMGLPLWNEDKEYLNGLLTK